MLFPGYFWRREVACARVGGQRIETYLLWTGYVYKHCLLKQLFYYKKMYTEDEDKNTINAPWPTTWFHSYWAEKTLPRITQPSQQAYPRGSIITLFGRGGNWGSGRTSNLPWVLQAPLESMLLTARLPEAGSSHLDTLCYHIPGRAAGCFWTRDHMWDICAFAQNII